MRNDFYKRNRLPAARWQTVSRPARQAAFAITLLIWLATQSLALATREQKSTQGQGAPPDLQITQVRPLSTSTTGATTDIEVRWTAQVSRLTTVDGFDVSLEVRHNDGSRQVVRSENLKPSARSAILKVATRSKPRSVGLKDFRVRVKAKFKIASSFTVAQVVEASPGDSFRASAGSSSTSQPHVFITSAKLVAQGCPQGQRCVEVKWTAVSPRHITVSEFKVNIDALYKNGTHHEDSKTVGGTERQARLQAGASGSELSSIKVSLLTSFFALDSKTVIKEGTLAQASFNGENGESDRAVQRQESLSSQE
jgi:hypothetical protein